jgi:hypothetical protein
MRDNLNQFSSFHITIVVGLSGYLFILLCVRGSVTNNNGF